MSSRPETMRAGVLLEDVHKRFGAVDVLKGVDLEIAPGEVVCIVGPSGSGKSTLLRCINHLEKLDGGRVTVGDEIIGYRPKRGKLYERRHSDIARQRSRLGMVFQQFNLFSNLTVLENVSEALIAVQKMPRARAYHEALERLSEVGLSDRGDAYPNQLSGGQQQRVAIARAVAMRPAVMLFDEPTSALDPELVGDVLAVMMKLADAGMTMVVVTHEIGFARQAADRLVFFADGNIVEQGPPDALIERPDHERTRQFLSAVL